MMETNPITRSALSILLADQAKRHAGLCVKFKAAVARLAQIKAADTANPTPEIQEQAQ